MVAAFFLSTAPGHRSLAVVGEDAKLTGFNRPAALATMATVAVIRWSVSGNRPIACLLDLLSQTGLTLPRYCPFFWNHHFSDRQ